MKNLLLDERNCCGIFSVTYKELGMEYLLLGVRNWDEKFAVIRTWVGTFTVRFKKM